MNIEYERERSMHEREIKLRARGTVRISISHAYHDGYLRTIVPNSEAKETLLVESGCV